MNMKVEYIASTRAVGLATALAHAKEQWGKITYGWKTKVTAMDQLIYRGSVGVEDDLKNYQEFIFSAVQL